MGRLGYIVDDERGGRSGADGGDGPGVVGAAPSTPLVPGCDEEASGTGTAGFTAFYADHYSDLVRLATLLCGSADTAPDLVQDCFVRLHGRWTAVHDPLPYARRSVVNACASHHRRVARGRRLPTPEAPDSELGADELADALGRLPARQRAAVVLRYYSDLPDADIARALRCRPGTVRSLIHRALKDLRERIEP
ncbi:MAG TPA: SigE family RNA polymerase sigma factor [Acidimicrobiales bacterium]|jgi:RNA polymerase sigma-70 factor (sigma-E family)